MQWWADYLDSLKAGATVIPFKKFGKYSPKKQGKIMSTITFDTLHFANKLKEAGFTEQQAQVLIELQIATTNNMLYLIQKQRETRKK